MKSCFYKQLYVNKLYNLEVGKFLETYNLLKLNQEEIENVNGQIIRNDMNK